MFKIAFACLLLALAAAPAPAEASVEPLQGTAESDQATDGGPATSSSEGLDPAYARNLDRTNWDLATALQALAGRSPVDIEVRWDGVEERYSGVFMDVSGTIHTLIQGTSAEWNTFFNDMGALAGRFLDVEVGYFDGVKRYSAVFLEDGDDYSFALRTTNTEAGFQDWLDQYLREGRNIIDFESYTEPGGDVRFAGVWVEDPNQPRTVLYYHLESADISDLIRPLAGRLIDFERYWSDTHSGYRYAVIVAMYPDGEWGHYRWMTSSELDDYDSSIADSNTHIIDLETWESSGTLYYGALWGDGPKSLIEVAPIPSDPDPQPVPVDLSNLTADFESAGQGVIGVYAKNFRTGQSLAYRPSEPFYLASSAKVAVHIRFWQDVEAGRFGLFDDLNYTNCDDCRDNWYVDERSFPGFDSSDFGNAFDLERFDRAMMQVSDNGATSALVDDEVIGVSESATDLNEWLSGVPGVGRGWWPVTSIHDVDRTIMWQGQVINFPSDTSFFTIPGWAFEPLWRTGSDTWGDLSDYLGNPPSLPRYNATAGHERYYAMGLNSSTPKAFVLLLEKFWEGAFLNQANTRNALQVMTEWTALDDLLPNHVDVWSKGGLKGGASRPLSNTGIMEIGPDAVGVVVFTKDNTRTDNTVLTYISDVALEVFDALHADLEPDMPSGSVSATIVEPTQSFTMSTDIRNRGGGDCASSFDVAFYASTNDTISSADHLIGTVRMNPIPGHQGSFATFDGFFPPSIPPGTYYVGVVTDTMTDDFSEGEIGEQDENNNSGTIPGVQINVLDTVIFADGFESGSVGAWN
ncbi:MAG: serine hydrolase [Thermoanaerobaculales bacterium]|jgi:hypothetical protein|nr:serine hydrolase [Thermoanaerobaculales bacterium]